MARLQAKFGNVGDPDGDMPISEGADGVTPDLNDVGPSTSPQQGKSKNGGIDMP